MEYVQFGRTGIRVSPLCLGCWNFGGVTDEAAAIRIIHRACDHGINFLDTAQRYTRGASETIVGKALEGRRDGVIVATKAAVARLPSDDLRSGASRRHLLQHVEVSLRRMRIDWIDLYQLHWPDPRTPIDETLRALDDLVRQGKVRYIGACNFAAWEMCDALWASDRLRLAPFVSLQSPYSILRRSIETDGLPFCRQHDVAVIPYSPLAGGWLSGRYRTGLTDTPDGGRMAGRREQLASPEGLRHLKRAERLARVAEKKGCTLSQFAIAWCLGNPAVEAPIIGPRTEEQLDDCMAALSRCSF